MANQVVALDGQSLTIPDVVAIARGDGNSYPRVILTEETRERMQKMRGEIERKIDAGEIMYGINTGCGSRSDHTILRKDLLRNQKKYIMSHCCGVGGLLRKEIVRAMLALRVNSFAVGHSGVTIELCDMILDLLNSDIIPAIPKYGSVGASGDLIPLAHVGAVLIGIPETEVFYKGEVCNTLEVFAKEGIQPYELQPKEAMGLTNGATMILAYSVLAVHDSEDLFCMSNILTALNMEAIRGEMNAFDPRIHKARRQHGQIVCARAIRKYLNGSRRVTKKSQSIHLPGDIERTCDIRRVQDAYSIRCVPQVHGAVWDAIIYLRKIVENELNAATDNPLIFENKDTGYSVLSGGNFHGEPLAIPLDTLAIAITNLAYISQCRLFRLLNTKLSNGLPQDLSGSDESDDTGLMLTQYCSASLVNMDAVLASPASVINVPTSGLQEDHVSMGATSAWKIRKIIVNAQSVFALELLAVCQAIDLAEKYLGEHSRLGAGTRLVHGFVRQHVPMMVEDRYLHYDIKILWQLIRSREIVKLLGH